MCIGLAGCGEQNEVSEKIELKRAQAPTYDDDKITVGFIQTGKESDWRDANTNDYLSTFTEEAGYNLIYVDGNSDSDRQVKAMYDLIAQKVDYIILNPIVENGWDDVLKAAKEADIPVIIADRQVNADDSLYVCWTGSDFYSEGVKAVRWLEMYLRQTGRDKEEINIVLLEGTEGSTAAIGRTEGIEDEAAKHSNWHIVEKRCANFTQGEGNTVMEEIIADGSDFDVVISENDNMMFGAMNAMSNAGISYGTTGDVITISFDALREAFEKMQAGELLVTVECNPLIAGLAENVIQMLEKGEEVEKVYYSEESVFTYENASYYIDKRQY